MNYNGKNGNGFGLQPSRGTPQELVARARMHLAATKPDSWGAWSSDRHNGFLVRKEGEKEFAAVSLSQITDARSLANWLAQLSEKTWATPGDLGNFVRAVGDVVGLREVARK